MLHPDREIVSLFGDEHIIGDRSKGQVGDFDAGFLPRLPDRALFRSLAIFQVTAGSRPGPFAMYVSAPGEQNLAVARDQYSNADSGLFAHDFSLMIIPGSSFLA